MMDSSQRARDSSLKCIDGVSRCGRENISYFFFYRNQDQRQPGAMPSLSTPLTIFV
jgi:hypothetical protein